MHRTDLTRSMHPCMHAWQGSVEECVRVCAFRDGGGYLRRTPTCLALDELRRGRVAASRRAPAHARAPDHLPAARHAVRAVLAHALDQRGVPASVLSYLAIYLSIYLSICLSIYQRGVPASVPRTWSAVYVCGTETLLRPSTRVGVRTLALPQASVLPHPQHWHWQCAVTAQHC